MRAKVESILFTLIAGTYLVNEAWGFYQKMPTISSLVTTILLYLPWVAAVIYIGYRLWTRPPKLTSPTMDELDIAIQEHARHLPPESEAAVEGEVVQKLGDNH